VALFGNKPDSKAPDAPAPRPHPAPAPSASHAAAHPPVPKTPGAACVIGANTTIKGEISGDDDLVIEGRVEGDVRAGRELRIAQSGSVKATVHARSIVIAGEVVGDCVASTRVEILPTGRLSGNIRAPKVVIAEGAVFRGNSDMSPREGDRLEKVATS
jgi:cytoskeletal protein CcmA (bactofilin family)